MRATLELPGVLALCQGHAQATAELLSVGGLDRLLPDRARQKRRKIR
jgi:hypothetical protein